eukprot:1533540-Rhodomonas_salina.1
MASKKRKSGELSLDKCPITGLPVNEKLAKKLKSFDTANKKTIQRILVNDLAWQQPANADAWSEQDWYNEYASTLLARQRDASTGAPAAVSSAASSASRSSASAKPARKSMPAAPLSPKAAPAPKPAPVRAKKESLSPLPAPVPIRAQLVPQETASRSRKAPVRAKPEPESESEEEEEAVPYNPQLSSSTTTAAKSSGFLSTLFWLI